MIKSEILLTGLFVMAIAFSGCIQEAGELGAVGSVMNIMKTDPTNEAKTLLSQLADMPGVVRESKSVGFQKDYTLASTALAERLPLSADQICFSLGDFAGSSEFQLLKEGEKQRIVYTGQGTNAKLKVLCDVRGSSLLESITTQGLEAGNSKTNCSGIQGRACLVYLAKV